MDIQELIKLADYLDQQGEHRAAEEIDELIKSAAPGDENEYDQGYPQDTPDTPEYNEALRQQQGRDIDNDAKQAAEQMEDMLMKMMYRVVGKGKYLPESFEVIHGELEDMLRKYMAALDEYLLSKDREGMGLKESMLGSVFEKLAGVADELDDAGQVKAADLVDGFLGKYADPVLEDELDWKERDFDKYDSEKHHKLQVREPKRDGEKADREGRKEHHIKGYQPHEGSLSTRYCPHHVGDMLARIGENVYQCLRDGEVFNWEEGYTDYNGNKIPGGSVAEQTPSSTGYAIPHRIWDTREPHNNPGK